MDIKIVLVALFLFVVFVLVAWKYSAKFRDKAGKYVDKDNDGKPFR